MATTYQSTTPPVEEANKTGPNQFVYPAWPTSKPGPLVTSPPPGQRPHLRRSDQMVYFCYDQERGRPCEPAAKSVIPEHRGKISLPDDRFQEEEAAQHWLDDGGTSEPGDNSFSGRQEEPVAVSSGERKGHGNDNNDTRCLFGTDE
jgi:hypothetical protein